MNCIIIDDIKSCSLLEEFVAKSSSLNHVGTFTDSVSGINQLSKCKDIDLVFLDFEVLKIDIFSYINSLECKPNIILLSQNDHFASKIYDFNVVDYILKPVTYPRFCKAVEKATRYYSHKDSGISPADTIFIKRESSLVKLKLKNIIFIEALENYIILNTKNERYTIHFTMKALENQLPADIFIRIHRSFIVNKNLIKAIHPTTLDLIIKDSLKNLPVGSSYRDVLLKNITVLEK